MIKCQFCLLATAIVRDVETNAISVHHVLEEFKSPSFPLVVANPDFFALLSREEDDPEIAELTFYAKMDDEILLEAQVKSEFEDTFRNRLTINIAGLVLPHPGLLKFELVSESSGLVAIFEARVSPIGKPPEVRVESDSSSDNKAQESKVSNTSDNEGTAAAEV